MIRNSTIARRLASQMWGEVQRQKSQIPGVWWFETASHGGYVVDVDLYPELKEFTQTVYVRKGKFSYYPQEQHFAPFEEDCDYAIVEYFMFDKIIHKLYKEYLLCQKQTLSFEQFSKQYKERLEASLQEWNADWFLLQKKGEVYELSRNSTNTGV